MAVSIDGVTYHGFTTEGEIELDVRLSSTRKRVSNDELLEAGIEAANASTNLPWLRSVRLTKQNTRLEKQASTWVKLFVSVVGA